MLTALYLTIGSAIAELLPYILKALQDVEEANSWRAWPRFEPRYLVGFIWAVIALAVSILFAPTLWTELAALPWWAVIGFSVSGTFAGGLGEKARKTVDKRIRRR